MVMNCNILPANTLSITLNEILGEVSHLILCALFWEAKTHACLEPISEFALATSSELDCSFVLSLDGGENVLGIGCICQAGAVISPLTKVPSVEEGVEDRAKVWETKEKFIDCLITIE